MQVVAEETQKEIDEARTHYAPCGAFNAVLFFCIRDLASVDPMYQYSLSWFIKLFVRSIQVRQNPCQLCLFQSPSSRKSACHWCIHWKQELA